MVESKMKGVSKRTIKGVTYWYAQLDGKKTYCGKGPDGRKRAEAARHKQQARKYEQKDIAAGLKVARTGFDNFAELAQWYMAKRKVKAQSCYGPKQAYCENLVAYFGEQPLVTITGDAQDDYRDHRVAQGAAAGTIDNEIALLSAMFNLAYKRERIDTMPRAFVKENAGSNPRRIITDEEFNLMHARAWRDPDFADVLICAWESAMRGAEIRKLTAAQIRLDVPFISGGTRGVADYIDLGIFDTKNKTPRRIPVSKNLKAVLIRRLKGIDGDDLVFTDKGSAYRAMSFRNRFQTACRRAKIAYGDKVLNKKGERVGITFHCLRHTRVTKWVKAKWSDEIIRQASGHKTLEAYRKYVRLDPVDLMCLVAETGKTGEKSAQTRTSIAI